MVRRPVLDWFRLGGARFGGSAGLRKRGYVPPLRNGPSQQLHPTPKVRNLASVPHPRNRTSRYRNPETRGPVAHPRNGVTFLESGHSGPYHTYGTVSRFQSPETQGVEHCRGCSTGVERSRVPGGRPTDRNTPTSGNSLGPGDALTDPRQMTNKSRLYLWTSHPNGSSRQD